ncbi:hypothetical protein HaLaN_24047, partial [Haematococcus lacustris]
MIGEPGSGPPSCAVLHFNPAVRRKGRRTSELHFGLLQKTMEGMCDELASTTNKSMLLTHDEFSTLYSSAGKYAAGSSSCANDKSQMLTLASAGQLVIGTKSGGRQRMALCTATFLSTAQPTTAQT